MLTISSDELNSLEFSLFEIEGKIFFYVGYLGVGVSECWNKKEQLDLIEVRFDAHTPHITLATKNSSA